MGQGEFFSEFFLPWLPKAIQSRFDAQTYTPLAGRWRMWAFMLLNQSFFTPRISALATAALVPRAACLALWDFLLSDERKSLVACCRESDSWCLRNAKDRRLQPKRRREVSREPRPLPAPETPATVPALLRVLERHVDRLANDLQRTTTFFANRQSLLDSRLSQICLQLDAIREQVFVQPTAVPLQPNLREVFDLNCPPHVAEQALQNSSVLLGAVRYHESRLDSVVDILDEVQAALRRR